jgi:C4-dicarboxylate-specific signal transduction histidine kinase
MTDVVIVAIITGTVTIFTGTLSALSLYMTVSIRSKQEITQRKQDELKEAQNNLHHQIDGRMDELLKLTRSSSKAEGVMQGSKDEQDKQNESRPQP